MNRRYFDAAIAGVLTLLVIAHMLQSALGVDRTMSIITALGLAVVVLFVGAFGLEMRVRSRRPQWPLALVVAGCFAMLITTAATMWPLKAAFAWSRPKLEQLAQRVRDDGPIASPTRIGPFVIERAELKPSGVVCLWTGLDPAGDTGFAQWPDRDVPLSLWSQLDLADDWHFVSED